MVYRIYAQRISTTLPIQLKRSRFLPLFFPRLLLFLPIFFSRVIFLSFLLPRLYQLSHRHPL
jgi:hypothetical protein